MHDEKRHLRKILLTFADPVTVGVTRGFLETIRWATKAAGCHQIKQHSVYYIHYDLYIIRLKYTTITIVSLCESTMRHQQPRLSGSTTCSMHQCT